jgi:hypothetical protein
MPVSETRKDRPRALDSLHLRANLKPQTPQFYDVLPYWEIPVAFPPFQFPSKAVMIA